MGLDIRTLIRALLIPVVIAAIASCGGSHSPLPGPGPDHVNVVTGVAATGGPIFGTVTLKDSSSPAKELTTSTASDGTFAFNTASLTTPFILKTSSGGKNYYSIASAGSGINNINPLTTLIVSIAAGGADLDALYAAGNASTLATLVLNLPGAETTVQTTLAPIFSQFGVSGSVINSSYAADHTGMDAILDVIDVSISAGTITLTNKGNSTVIFTASAGNFGAGSLVTANIPAVPTLSLGATLYRSKCSTCHGDISNSSIIGRSSVVKIMGAITSDFGGMSTLGDLTPEEIQAISDAIPAQATPPAPGTLSGATLYSTNCALCHGPLATSTKLGVTIVRIQNAISANTGNMGRLSTLSATDLQAIVAALNPTPTTPVPPTTLDGATIYANNCAGCHNPLATSTKTGLTVARFYSAVTTPATGMEYLATLSMAQVQALIAVLPSNTTPGASSGQVAYETNCAGCHGAFANSTKAQATVARINAAITANTGGMGVFSTLTPTQITDIAAALATVSPPPAGATPGETLYGTYCSGCHNPFATSTKAGPTMTLARIQAGITANPSTMGSFATTLTTQNLTDIATALAALAAPVLDGPGLYAANCQSCHGALASSTKGGATAAKIQASITDNRAGVMGAANLTALTPTQIDLITTALASVTPPSCGSCHAVALASLTSGKHNFHATSTKITGTIKTQFAATTSCAICHGTGYTTTSNVAATHNDGAKNVAITATGTGIRTWIPPTTAAKGQCTPSCHGKKSW